MTHTKNGIYIHVPWCKRRCPYCNFYLKVGEPDKIFINRIIEEYQYKKSSIYFSQADTLYFGGGTPSLLSTNDINSLVGFFKTNKILKETAEITLEANPEDITEDFLFNIKSSINRLSLGVQSFDDQILNYLGRKHTGKDALRVIKLIKSFEKFRLSVDLIFGVPMENHKELFSSINLLENLGVSHVSMYLLTIEERTLFYKKINKKQIPNIDDDYQAEIYKKAQKKFLDLKFIQYDVSSYAKNNDFSIHNQVYWSGGSYLGLGPGAHSMVLMPSGETLRWSNKANIKKWLENSCSEDFYDWEKLSLEQSLRESLAFGLRNMVRGINPKELSLRHKTPLPSNFVCEIQSLIEKKWLYQNEDKIIVSDEGALFLDAIMRQILS